MGRSAFRYGGGNAIMITTTMMMIIIIREPDIGMAGRYFIRARLRPANLPEIPHRRR